MIGFLSFSTVYIKKRVGPTLPSFQLILSNLTYYVRFGKIGSFPKTKMATIALLYSLKNTDSEFYKE